MSTVKVQGSATGTANFTVTTPSGSSTDRTFTLPDNTGTILTSASSIPVSQLSGTIAGNGPAFSATKSVNQPYSSSTYTKITFPDELYDTASCYDTSTSRFTPNVAGYYQVNITMYHNYSAGTPNVAIVLIYKNGSADVLHNIYQSAIWGRLTLSALIYMNGTTDYIEAYAYMDATPEISGGATSNRFSAFLARAA